MFIQPMIGEVNQITVKLDWFIFNFVTSHHNFSALQSANMKNIDSPIDQRGKVNPQLKKGAPASNLLKNDEILLILTLKLPKPHFDKMTIVYTTNLIVFV